MTEPSFGIDAPTVVRNAALALSICLPAAVVALLVGSALAISLAAATFGLIAIIAAMLASSLLIKPRICRRMIDAAAMRGDEQVLDVGCGRGLLLIEVAGRLSSGRAVGVDIWSTRDQSGNSADATRANLQAANVAAVTEVVDGDATRLPFENETFDLVVSSMVFHNIPDVGDRARAISEVERVLRPGGRVAVLDFLNTRAYARTLAERGMERVKRSRPTFLFFSAARIVSAEKPARGRQPGGYAP